MTHRHAVLLLCVVGVVLLAPSIVAQETPTPTATANATNESDDAGMGTQMTAFLQSSSAAANDSVENGMWQARFDQANASERAQLVTNRAGTLEERLAQLQARNETIQSEYENGSLPQPAYVAQQSQLSARIAALQTAINDTDAAATEAGVNDSRLETLRQNASELTGPQVAAVARGLGGGPPETAGPPGNRTAGPPDQAGPPGNQTAGPPNEAGPPGNQTTGPPNETGPPGNQTSGPPNETGQAGNETGDAATGSSGAGGNDSSESDGGSEGAGGSGAEADSGSSSGGSGTDSGNGAGSGSGSGNGSGSSGNPGSGSGSGAGGGN